MEREYQTTGSYYQAETMTGVKTLIALDYSDYEQLLAVGLMDEEVDLTMEKAEYGVEYAQGVPTFSCRAGLYTITIEGTNAKPQMDIDESITPEIEKRGFKDGDKVKLTIKGLPYHNPREANYDGLKLDLDL